jgi:hypothetical protein
MKKNAASIWSSSGALPNIPRNLLGIATDGSIDSTFEFSVCIVWRIPLHLHALGFVFGLA